MCLSKSLIRSGVSCQVLLPSDSPLRILISDLYLIYLWQLALFTWAMFPFCARHIFLYNAYSRHLPRIHFLPPFSQRPCTSWVHLTKPIPHATDWFRNTGHTIQHRALPWPSGLIHVTQGRQLRCGRGRGVTGASRKKGACS